MDRRTFLERGASTIGVAVGLSGCIGSILDDSAGDLERWLVDPDGEVAEYEVVTTSRVDLEPVSERLEAEFWDGYRRDHLGPIFGDLVGDDFDRTVAVSAGGDVDVSFQGVTGEFDLEEVGSDLESLGFSRGDSSEGYRLYERDSMGSVAVRGDGLIGMPSQDRYVASEAVLDAVERSDAYTDADPKFDRLLSAIPDGQIRHANLFEPVDELDIQRQVFEGTYAVGDCGDVGPNETRHTVVWFVTDAKLVSESDVETIFERFKYDAQTSATYEIDDDVVTFEATIPTADLG